MDDIQSVEWNKRASTTMEKKQTNKQQMLTIKRIMMISDGFAIYFFSPLPSFPHPVNNNTVIGFLTLVS